MSSTVSSSGASSSCCPCFAGFVQPESPKTRRSYQTSVRRKVSERFTSVEAEYDCKEILGEGAFGVVRKVASKQTGEERVMKYCEKDKIQDIDAFLYECELQADLDHPHVCRIFDCFQNQSHITIIMEICRGGDLGEYLDEFSNLQEADARIVFGQIMYGVSYMHGHHVCHRDLKPENFLLRFGNKKPITERLIKISDFGFARSFTPGKKHMQTICGSPLYMAPDLWGNPYDEKCDVWSCGVILYQMLCGIAPFGNDDEPDEIFKKAKAGKISFEEKQWDSVSGFAKLLIHQCLKLNADARISAEYAMSTDWLKRERTQTECELLLENRAKSGKLFAEGCVAYEQHTDFYKAAAFQIAHCLSDGKLNELREMFEQLDSDRNGSLSIGELRQGLAEVGVSSGSIQDMFEGEDEEKSIQFTQFVEVMISGSRKDPSDSSWRKACLAAYHSVDTDGNNTLGKQEIRILLGRLGIDPVSDEMVESALRDVDTKQQGFIDFDEFMDYVTPQKATNGQTNVEADQFKFLLRNRQVSLQSEYSSECDRICGQ